MRKRDGFSLELMLYANSSRNLSLCANVINDLTRFSLNSVLAQHIFSLVAGRTFASQLHAFDVSTSPSSTSMCFFRVGTPSLNAMLYYTGIKSIYTSEYLEGYASVVTYRKLVLKPVRLCAGHVVTGRIGLVVQTRTRIVAQSSPCPGKQSIGFLK